MIGRAACVAIVAAVAAAASFAQAQASAPWTAPVAILKPPPRTSLDGPAIAFSRAGRGLVTWYYALANGHTGQRAAPWRSGPSLARSHDLRTRIEAPLVYRDRAFALVRASDVAARRLRVVFGTASGRFGAERTIYTSPPDTRFAIARAAANERGDIAVIRRAAFEGGRERIVLLERPAGGRLGRARLVADIPVCRCYSVSSATAVAVGARGDVAVAWAQAQAIFVRVRSAGGLLGPALRVGPAGDARSLAVALSPRGAAWVAWLDNPADQGTGTGSMTVRLAVRPAGAGRFGAARKLDHVARTSALFGSGVHVALDPRGAGFVLWSMPGKRCGGVCLASAGPGGAGVRVRRLSSSVGQSPALVLLTSRRAGEAFAVWAEVVGEEFDRSRIVARHVAPGGSLGDAEVVSTSDHAGPPAAAFDPAGGRVTVVWAELLPKPTPRSPSQGVLLAARRGV